MSEQAYLTRQEALIPADVARGIPVTVIGAGAIGSHVVLQLVKMGVYNITVWDPDTVAIENMSNQGYRFKDIGRPKVDALADMAEDFMPPEQEWRMQCIVNKWEPSHLFPTRGIVVFAVDDMDARRNAFEAIQDECRGVECIIDTRMGAENALMYVIDPFNTGDVASYKKTLYANSDAVQEPCTAKATIYTANLLSGWAVKAIKNIIAHERYPRITQWSIRDNAMQVYTNGK